MQRLGKYPPPPGVTDIPGLELAGEVVATRGTTTVEAGQAVCALVAGGAYAEYCAVPSEQCLPVPRGLSLAHAAAIPETFFTVWTNLFDRGKLREGETVLVHGGTSGIGTTAIQLARAFGAIVIATAGSDEKCEACRAPRRRGSRSTTTTADFVAEVRAATGQHGVDVILDIVGGDYLPRNLECLRIDGRLVQIGLIGGSRASLDLRGVLQKRLTLTGSTLRPRSPAEKGRDRARSRATRVAAARSRRRPPDRARRVPAGACRRRPPRTRVRAGHRQAGVACLLNRRNRRCRRNQLGRQHVAFRPPSPVPRPPSPVPYRLASVVLR